MSDTTQPSAPPPSTPAPAQPTPPQQTEVPVNEAPVSAPTPIGDQAPPKPAHVARQEALEKAFAKATEAQAAAKRERPGMGHNKPPEAMAREPEKAADKAERTGKPSEAQQRYREGGKFAKDPAKAEPPKAEPPQPGQQQLPLGEQPAKQAKQPIKPLDERAPYREPPGRFSEQAKQEWHSSPESVRGAVYQMAREFQGAYEKYKGDHTVMEELRPYQDLVTKQNTSIRKALDNYYGIEQKIRQDWVGGIDIVVQNVARANGWKRPDGGPITVQDFAAHVLSMSPEQHRMSRQENSQTSAEMRIGQLHQQVEEQNQILRQMVYQQKFAGTRAEVDKFAEQHPRFDELADQIKLELDLGFPLEQAYARADKLRPSSAPQAAQTRTQSAQTRKTSISGAPDGNGVANTRPSAGQRRNGEAKHPTIQQALERAARRVGNGV
jgi:hypothetical protein